MMDNPAPQLESERQQLSRKVTILQILDRIENWLTGVFEITEEEKLNAGIHFDDQRHE